MSPGRGPRRLPGCVSCPVPRNTSGRGEAAHHARSAQSPTTPSSGPASSSAARSRVPDPGLRAGPLQMHDLLRAHNREPSAAHDRNDGQHAAVTRLLGHCLHSPSRDGQHVLLGVGPPARGRQGANSRPGRDRQRRSTCLAVCRARQPRRGDRARNSQWPARSRDRPGPHAAPVPGSRPQPP